MIGAIREQECRSLVEQTIQNLLFLREGSGVFLSQALDERETYLWLACPKLHLA